MTDDTWYVTNDGETTVGPVSTEQLQRGVAAGKIPSTAKVNRVGTSEWLEVGAVPELTARPAGDAGSQPLAPPAPLPPRAPKPPVLRLFLILLFIIGSALGLWIFRARAEQKKADAIAAAHAALEAAARAAIEAELAASKSSDGGVISCTIKFPPPAPDRRRLPSSSYDNPEYALCRPDEDSSRLGDCFEFLDAIRATSKVPALGDRCRALVLGEVKSDSIYFVCGVRTSVEIVEVSDLDANRVMVKYRTRGAFSAPGANAIGRLCGEFTVSDEVGPIQTVSLFRYGEELVFPGRRPKRAASSAVGAGEKAPADHGRSRNETDK